MLLRNIMQSFFSKTAASGHLGDNPNTPKAT